MHKLKKSIELDIDENDNLKRPTATDLANNKTTLFNIMQVSMVKTLINPQYKLKWANYVANFNYDFLLKQLIDKGPAHFMIPTEYDRLFKGAKGGVLWAGLIKYMKDLGEKGFQKFLHKLMTLPPEIPALELIKKGLINISLEKEEKKTNQRSNEKI